MELALELGAADFAVDDDTFEIYTLPADYGAIRDELERRELPLVAKELAMLPQSHVKLNEESAPRVLRLMEVLEEHDDVQRVWANFDIDSEVLAAHSG